MTTTTTTVEEAVEEIVAALEPLTSEIPGLQVTAGANPFPTPPSIDVFPGDPFLAEAGFNRWKAFFTVRARVSTVDTQAGQRLLWRLLDPHDPASVIAALADTVGFENDNPIAGYREYVEDSVQNGRLLGSEWRVSVFL